MRAFIISLILFCSTCHGAGNSRQTEIIAATLILEAGGEQDSRAMGAVLEVIQNRGKQRKMALDAVCLQRAQFSCWNGKRVEDGIIKAKRHPKWSRAVELVTQSSSSPTNYTNGATHYHASWMKAFPRWTKDGKLRKTAQIGLHIFYK